MKKKIQTFVFSLTVVLRIQFGTSYAQENKLNVTCGR